MESFFLSAVASFVVTTLLMVSSVTTKGRFITLKIGSVLTIRAVRTVAIFLVLSFCVISLVTLVLLVVGRIHPSSSAIYKWSEFLSGRPFSSAILGLLFGTLFAFWLRDLLGLEPSEKVGWKPIAQAVVLTCLLALGAFSDIIGSYADRISQINVGGAQFSFSSPKDIDVSARGEPGGGSSYAGPGASESTGAQGLSLIAGLKARINNDHSYIENIFSPGTTKRTSADADHANFHEAIFGSLARCLQSVAEISVDSTIIDDHLRRIARPLQEVMTARKALSADRRKMIATEVVTTSGSLVEHIRHTYLQLGTGDLRRHSIEAACRPLIARCSTGESEHSSLSELAAQCSKRNPELEQQTLKGLESLLDDDARFERPYMSMTYAGLMWRFRQYSTATSELDKWLRDAKDKRGRLHPWREARARIVLSGILEEWIRNAANPPSGLVEYHLSNLHEAIELMSRLLSGAVTSFGEVAEDIERDGYRGRLPGAGNRCAKLAAEEHASQKVHLVLSLLSQHIVYIYRAVQMPDYYDTYSSNVMKFRNSLLRIDLFCVSNILHDFKEMIDELYAEILEVYAEVELANATRIQLLSDRDAIKIKLQRASVAATLGQQLIANYAKAARQGATGASLVLAPSRARELENSFKAIQIKAARRLKSL
jgi:hypothetical protein